LPHKIRLVCHSNKCPGSQFVDLLKETRCHLHTMFLLQNDLIQVLVQSSEISTAKKPEDLRFCNIRNCIANTMACSDFSKEIFVSNCSPTDQCNSHTMDVLWIASNRGMCRWLISDTKSGVAPPISSIESLFGIDDSSKEGAKHLLWKSTDSTLSNWPLLKAPSPGPF
jgi:hypothetical protein